MDEQHLHEEPNDLVNKLALILEKMRIAEYVELTMNPLRLIYVNFLAGVARGLGMAVGFTLLSALVIYLLRQIVLLNLPLISDFIARIVRMVLERTY